MTYTPRIRPATVARTVAIASWPHSRTHALSECAGLRDTHPMPLDETPGEAWLRSPISDAPRVPRARPSVASALYLWPAFIVAVVGAVAWVLS